MANVTATLEPTAAIFSEMTMDVPSIDNTFGFEGEEDIPLPVTTCPTLMPTLLATVIVEEFLTHDDDVGVVTSAYTQVCVPVPVSVIFTAPPPTLVSTLNVLVVLSLT